MPKTRLVDLSINFSVEVPENVPTEDLVVYGDFVVEDVEGRGFVKQISAEEHTLEVWGEED